MVLENKKKEKNFYFIFLAIMTGAAFGRAMTQAAILEIFADSSLSGALEQIKENYAVYHQVNLEIKFASSDELTKLISQGITCDIFIPAGSEYLEGLKIIESSRINLVQKDNKIYPAVVMSSTRNEKPALRFLGYLTNNEAGQIFRKEGFVQVQPSIKSNKIQGDKAKIKSKSKSK